MSPDGYVEANPMVIEVGNEARRRKIRREIARLEAELKAITPKLADVLDPRD